jgi:anhydro-N-acetylmuramic acid kinase
MSGTSLDGVDAAILDTDGERIEAFGPTLLEPYSTAERSAIADATAAMLRDDRAGRPCVIDPHIAALVTEVHWRAFQRIAGTADPIDLIAFHGQTLLHRPARQLTLQAGDAARLAALTGIPVIADLRQADLAAGGEGAPLVPIYHRELARRLGLPLPAALLNIGGVANVSWIANDGLRAFDIGPGNGLIDQYMERAGLGSFDKDGALAAVGQADPRALEALLVHPFLALGGPKSLDRFDITLDPVLSLAPADAARTLTAFTAACVAQSVALLPEPPAIWLVCGGGRHNPVLMAELRARLAADVRSCDHVGLRGDFIEAEAMAYLAARHQRGLPTSFPETTGAGRPVVGGRLYPVAGAA